MPAQAAPGGEIRPKAPRTDPEPQNNAVRVRVSNISTPRFPPSISISINNEQRPVGPSSPTRAGRRPSPATAYCIAARPPCYSPKRGRGNPHHHQFRSGHWARGRAHTRDHGVAHHGAARSAHGSIRGCDGSVPDRNATVGRTVVARGRTARRTGLGRRLTPPGPEPRALFVIN